MLSVLLIILPIFALIFLGWMARKTGILGEHALREINRFVVYLALPALIFDIVVSAGWDVIWRPDLIGAFGIGCAAIYLLTVAISIWMKRHLADAAIDGLNAAYANTAFIGFPLMFAAFGDQSRPPVLITSVLTACLLFGMALVLIEVGQQKEARPLHMVRNVAKSLSRNPLILAPALGAVFLVLGIGLPQPVDTSLKLLGGAASPCALVAIGLFLAEKRQEAKPPAKQITMLVMLKLIGQPALTYVLAAHVFHMSDAAMQMAVVISALPTGTGPFMAAEFYGRKAGITSRSILFSTIGSVLSVTLLLSLLGVSA